MFDELRAELKQLGLVGPVAELLIANVIVGNYSCWDALRVGRAIIGHSS